ncbi:MAG: ion transporter [Candidatus Omnitrophota bacterium]
MEPYKGGRDSTRLSLAMDLFILACILISCAAVPLEYIFPEHLTFFTYTEFVFAAIFIVEYVLRWYSSANRLIYPFTLYALIDLIAIVPSLLMLCEEMLLLRAFRGMRLLRLVRLLRLLRLLKFLRYGFLIYRGMISFRIWFSVLNYQYRLRQLGRLFFYGVLIWIIGAHLLFFTESLITEEAGPFSDYGKSYWNILIVLISGIEDKEPISTLGRVEVTIFLIAGIIVVGMLTAEIVSILVRKVHRAGKIAIKPPEGVMKHHIVILGENSNLDNVIRQVNAALDGKYFFLIISPIAEELKIPDPVIYKKVFAISGDPVKEEVLTRADIDHALRVVLLSMRDPSQSTVSIDNRTLMIALAVASRKRGIPMTVELLSGESLHYAKNLAGADFILSRHYIERLASQAVLHPGVTEIYNELMTFTGDSCEFYTVPVPSHLVGKTFKEAQLYFLDHDEEAIVVIGVDFSSPEEPNTRFWINPINCQDQLPPSEIILDAKDHLIIIAYELPSFAAMAEEDLWSGKRLSRS